MGRCDGETPMPRNYQAAAKVSHTGNINQNIYEKFQWLLLADRSCGRWRQGVLCVIQSLPHPDFGCVTRFAEWFCVRPSFLFSPFPLPHLKSPLPEPLRKAWYSGDSFGGYSITDSLDKKADDSLKSGSNYPALLVSSGFSRPDATLRRERNYC